MNTGGLTTGTALTLNRTHTVAKTKLPAPTGNKIKTPPPPLTCPHCRRHTELLYIHRNTKLKEKQASGSRWLRFNPKLLPMGLAVDQMPSALGFYRVPSVLTSRTSFQRCSTAHTWQHIIASLHLRRHWAHHRQKKKLNFKWLWITSCTILYNASLNLPSFVQWNPQAVRDFRLPVRCR